MSLHYQILQTKIELEEFFPQWLELEKSIASYPSFNALLLVNWWKRYCSFQHPRFGKSQKLAVVTAHRDGALVACLPLEILFRKRKFLTVRELVFLSAPFNGMQMDIFQKGLNLEEIRKMVLFALRSTKADILDLTYLPEDSAILDAFPSDIFLHSAYLIIGLGRTYEEVRSSVYTKNLRHILNKFQRRIRECWPQIIGEVTEDREEIRKLGTQIRKVSTSKLLSGMHSIYTDEVIGEEYLNNILNRTSPYCALIRNGEELIAYNMGFVDGKTVYALDAAYDRTFPDAQIIGLGMLAYDEVVKNFASRQLELNMGHGIDNYKFRFTKDYRKTYRLILSGNRILSRLIYRHSAMRIKKNSAAFETQLKKNLNRSE